MKDQRGQSKTERRYLDRQNLQACIVCGGLFTRRVADKICSITCQALKDRDDGKRKAEEKQAEKHHEDFDPPAGLCL